MDKRSMIAKRISKEFVHGTLVNLGVGIPTLCTSYVPEEVRVIYHSENGIVGMGPTPGENEINEDCFDAGGKAASLIPGWMFYRQLFVFWNSERRTYTHNGIRSITG